MVVYTRAPDSCQPLLVKRSATAQNQAVSARGVPDRVADPGGAPRLSRSSRPARPTHMAARSPRRSGRSRRRSAGPSEPRPRLRRPRADRAAYDRAGAWRKQTLHLLGAPHVLRCRLDQLKSSNASARRSHSAALRAEKPISRSLIPARPSCPSSARGSIASRTVGSRKRVRTLVSSRCVSAMPARAARDRRRRARPGAALTARAAILTGQAQRAVDGLLDRRHTKLCARVASACSSMSTRCFAITPVYTISA